jgi:integrase/recombinase XerD
MSRQGLWKLIKNYVYKAGIKSDITPFTLRHSFAMHLLDNGADVSSVQELMGYSDSNTISKYTGKNKRSQDPFDWARIRN